MLFCSILFFRTCMSDIAVISRFNGKTEDIIIILFKKFCKYCMICLTFPFFICILKLSCKRIKLWKKISY